MIKNRKKKGFTIVELVIVIAVIGILAAILIPTFVNLTARANRISNESFVRNINTQLAMDDAENKKHETLESALAAAKKIGFHVDVITPYEGNDIVWDEENDRFAIVKGDFAQNKDADHVVFADSTFDASKVKLHKLWKFYEQGSVPAATNQTYSIAPKGAWNLESIDISVGFDACGISGLQTINYSNDGPAQSVVIRTNSQFTDLNIDADADTVVHFGVGKDLDITAIADESYHERGSWRKITLESGKLELEKGSFVGEVEKNGGKLVNEGVIATPVTGTAATEDVSGSGTAGLNPTSVIKVGNAETLINLAFAQSTGVFDDFALNIELTADIDLTDKTWVPFGAEVEDPGTTYKFSGTIDGKDHKITGLYNGSYKGKVTQNHSTSTIGDLYGFIATVKDDVTVKNITFAETAINDENSKVTGAVVADTKGADTVTLYKVHVTGSIVAKDKVGGLIGYAQSARVLIQECSVNVMLKAIQTSDHNRVGGLIGYIGNLGIVSVYDTDVKGTITGVQNNKMFGALAGGLTSYTYGVGLKAEGFTTSASVKEPATGKRTTTSDGKVIIGVNSCKGEDSQVNLSDGFAFQKAGNEQFLPKID